MTDPLTQLTPHLFVYRGGCNVGILSDGERALLIDCGTGAVQTVLFSMGITQIERILFTHHHRDSASGVQLLAGVSTKLGVPNGERRRFEAV